MERVHCRRGVRLEELDWTRPQVVGGRLILREAAMPRRVSSLDGSSGTAIVVVTRDIEQSIVVLDREADLSSPGMMHHDLHGGTTPSLLQTETDLRVSVRESTHRRGRRPGYMHSHDRMPRHHRRSLQVTSYLKLLYYYSIILF